MFEIDNYIPFRNSYEEFTKFCETWPIEKCWIWPNALDTNGYPIAWLGTKQIKLHRESFRLFNGPLEKTDVVRHSCDTPSCFNPDHLLKGTHNDNVQDRVSRNRSAIGEFNGRSKLVEAQVLDIFYSNWAWTWLAKKYCVDRKTIQHIKVKKTWKYLTKDLQSCRQYHF